MSAVTVESAARLILAANGAPDPHPDLLADTVREVEYHGIPAHLTAEPEGWHVERNDYEVPCEHVACDLMHRHLYNGAMDRTLIEVYDMRGNLTGHRWETGVHMRTVRQWSVVNPEGYAVESYDTRREARANLSRFEESP